MKINYNSDKVIIIQFTRFAGGKFISNCLALSKYAVPQYDKAGIYLLTNPDDYDYRLSQIQKTLPQTVEEMKQWIETYEFGENQQNSILEQLSNSNLNFFITAHSPEETAGYLKSWPNAKVIVLTNVRKFSDIARERKGTSAQIDDKDFYGVYCVEKYNLYKINDWPTWDQFNDAKFDIRNLVNVSKNTLKKMARVYKSYQINVPTIGLDIDNCIFDKVKFLSSMEKLYATLGYDDFNSELIMKFWGQYMNLHVKIVQQ